MTAGGSFLAPAFTLLAIPGKTSTGVAGTGYIVTYSYLYFSTHMYMYVIHGRLLRAKELQSDLSDQSLVTR